jgi:hypothetical protein
MSIRSPIVPRVTSGSAVVVHATPGVISVCERPPFPLITHLLDVCFFQNMRVGRVFRGGIKEGADNARHDVHNDKIYLESGILPLVLVAFRFGVFCCLASYRSASLSPLLYAIGEEVDVSPYFHRHILRAQLQIRYF